MAQHPPESIAPDAAGPGSPRPGPRSSEPAPTAQPAPQPRQIELSAKTIWQTIGAILLTLMLLRAAQAASTLLGMLAISFFFSLALDPAARMLHKRYGWRRGAAVGVIYLAGIAFVVFLVAILIPAVGQLADQISANAGDWVSNLNTWTQDNLGVPVPGDAAASAAPQAGDLLGNATDNPFGTVLGFAAGGVSFVFNLATVAMFTFYLTADAPRIQKAVLGLFSPQAQQRIGWTWEQAIVQTGGYFYSRILLMVINGTGFFITMVLVGVPTGLSLGLAVFAGFVSEFIPAIGTYLGGAVPIALTLALQGLVPALVVLAYVLVYQQIENYWLSPKISANTMSLNGGIAFGAALFGGAVAGAMGAFVALPVAALISASISNYARSYEVVYASHLDEPVDAAATPDTADDTATGESTTTESAIGDAVGTDGEGSVSSRSSPSGQA
ncbi:MAG TPA: AI-2E family transporter [Nitriliruptoraceae bacterium]|nr:AI-2E family transporter [Nitriliruptoraceae bacterium]